MAQRCRECPGGATHFGSGWAAKRAACSASERKPETTRRAMPAGAGRGRHPVEGGGDVRAHPLAVAVDERAAVAAAAGHRRHPTAGAGRRGGFGDRRRLGPRPAAADVEVGHHLGLRPHRRERGEVGKGEAEPARVDAVRPAGIDRGRARLRQVGGLVEVDGIRQAVRERRRREQPRQVVAHRAGGRDRREVGRPLHPPLAGHRPGDRDQHQRPGKQGQGSAEGEDQGLARLLAQARLGPYFGFWRRSSIPMPRPWRPDPHLWCAQANDFRTLR